MVKNKLGWFVLITMIILPLSLLYSGELSWSVENSISDIQISEFMDYDLIMLDGGREYSEVGFPSLPSIVKHFSIPRSSKLLSVTFDEVLWERVGNYNIMPAQELIPIGSQIFFTSQNEQIYSTNRYYPEEQIINFGTGNKSGFMIGWIEYSPFRYNPVTKDLEMIIKAKVLMKYEEGLEEVIYLTSSQREVFGGQVEDLVENSFDVFKNAPFVKDGKFPVVEYVIVTPSNLVNSFSPLVDWKIQKGVSAVVISKDWVTSNYSGYYDDMESIREFVKDYHQNHGLIYFVLAGDHNNLGARIVPLSAGSYTDNTPCDLYFSDVVPYTSNWDANGNHQYGERTGDGCDWYSDVYVGRFPVNTTAEADVWVNKILNYEQNPPSGFIERSLQGGAGLWVSQNYYGDRVCDSIADNHLPSWWTHTKMYENYGNTAGFSDSLSLGYGWCHIAGHGNKDGVYWDGPGSLIYSSDNITNGMKLGVIHSIACMPGWFDNYDCVGEYYFNYSNGGAIAIMFNGRYGWGNPPNLGPSEWLDIWTAGEVFDNENWNIGAGHGLGKDHIIPGMDGYDHWCLTELNLFGDPETQIYSREPVAMNVTNPAVINIGSGSLPVSVNSTRGPVEGAVCCLWKSGDTVVWYTDTTNSSGNALVPYSISSPDPLLLTVYAHNHLYYVDTINIATSGAYIIFVGIESISGGYDNNQINAGCNYEMSISVSNYGNQSSNNVKGVINSSDPYISIQNDTLLFGDIVSNDTVISSNTCGFSISDSVPDGYYISLILECFDQNDSLWESSFGINANSPDLELYSVGGPEEIHPGDNFYIWSRIENTGSGTAYALELTIYCDDPYVTLLDSEETFNALAPGGLSWIGEDSAFNISLSSSCPEPYWIDIELNTVTDGGYSFTDTFTFSVGNIAFTEDFESGIGDWTYSGSSCWHITSRRYNSSNHSMFSGNESGSYSNNLSQARVISPVINVSNGDTMTFWHWYEIEDDGQGWDGCRLEISTDGGSSWSPLYTLEGYDATWYYNSADSIFTGNQLQWEERHVVFDVNGQVNICWRFDTDGYVEHEGYYFDDIDITGGSGFLIVEESGNIAETYTFALHRAYPNPVSSRTTINYSIGSNVNVNLNVYDITGREVRNLVNTMQTPGTYKIQWDGRDNRGELVSNGTYFYRLIAGSFSDGDKLIVIR